MLNINVKNLQTEVEERERRKFNTFDKVLDACYAKILSTNQKNTDCCCLYTCPPVIFGVPLYNVTDCVKYVMDKLIKKDFKIYFTHPNLLFISWKNEVQDTKAIESDNNIDHYKKRADKPKIIDKFQRKQLLYEPSMYELQIQDQPRYQDTISTQNRDNYMVKNSLTNSDLLPPRNNNPNNPNNDHNIHIRSNISNNNRNRNYNNTSSNGNSNDNNNNYRKLDKKQTPPKEFRPISDYHEKLNVEYGYGGSSGADGNNQISNMNDMFEIGLFS